MKLLILSDSHGWTEELGEVIDQYREQVAKVIHCGDSELSVAADSLQDVLAVRGNCDGIEGGFPEELETEVDSLQVYVTHGHLYNVKMTPVPLTYRGEEVGANLVCFGHSHVAESFKENGILYINPGSLRLPRGRKEQTYCILEWDSKNEQAIVDFYDRSGRKVEELSHIYQLTQT